MKKRDNHITTVYVEQIITDYCKANKIVLSNWINSTFINQFLSIDAKTKQVEEIEKKKKGLLREIEEIKERTKNLIFKLTSSEVKDVETVNARVKGGADINSILRQFNNSHSRSLTIEEFKQIVDLHESKKEYNLKCMMENYDEKNLK